MVKEKLNRGCCSAQMVILFLMWTFSHPPMPLSGFSSQPLKLQSLPWKLQLPWLRRFLALAPLTI
uniref:Uncharacterized protein n=1 Tax=Brassica oleracea var. oleracea TaxID=109376 RepID=A0A0D3CF81_BRAOL